MFSVASVACSLPPVAFFDAFPPYSFDLADRVVTSISVATLNFLYNNEIHNSHIYTYIHTHILVYTWVKAMKYILLSASMIACEKHRLTAVANLYCMLCYTSFAITNCHILLQTILEIPVSYNYNRKMV